MELRVLYADSYFTWQLSCRALCCLLLPALLRGHLCLFCLGPVAVTLPTSLPFRVPTSERSIGASGLRGISRHVVVDLTFAPGLALGR